MNDEDVRITLDDDFYAHVYVKDSGEKRRHGYIESVDYAMERLNNNDYCVLHSCEVVKVSEYTITITEKVILDG